MAERFYFFNSTDNDQRLYDAEDFADYFKRFLLDGIYDDQNNLEVVANNNGMTVSVREGSAFIQGHLYVNDSLNTLELEESSPLYDRIDRIVLRLNRTQDERNIKATVLKGEPSENPSLPTMRKDEYAYDFPLANVYVYSGRSTISSAQVTDERKRAIHAFTPEQIGTYSGETLDTFQKFKLTSDDGFVKYDFSSTNDDVFSVNRNLDTFFSTPGVKNHPPTNVSVRGVYVTEQGKFGEILAMGHDGSLWRASQYNGTWTKWNQILGMNEHSSNRLWSGEVYPQEGQTIRPSKNLKDCRNGWLLIWSDYDVGVGANNFHFVHSPIHKGIADNNNGGYHIVTVGYSNSESSAGITGKSITIYNDRIVGREFNDLDSNYSRDVVLRYVYEW